MILFHERRKHLFTGEKHNLHFHPSSFYAFVQNIKSKKRLCFEAPNTTSLLGDVWTESRG